MEKKKKILSFGGSWLTSSMLAARTLAMLVSRKPCGIGFVKFQASNAKFYIEMHSKAEFCEFALETWNLIKPIPHGFLETNAVFF